MADPRVAAVLRRRITEARADAALWRADGSALGRLREFDARIMQTWLEEMESEIANAAVQEA